MPKPLKWWELTTHQSLSQRLIVQRLARRFVESSRSPATPPSRSSETARSPRTTTVPAKPVSTIYTGSITFSWMKLSRRAAGMVKYMRAQVGPASKDILTVEAYEKFLKVQEPAIIGFFEKESDLKGIFTKYSDQQREKFRFGHSSDPAVLAKAGEKWVDVFFWYQMCIVVYVSSCLFLSGTQSFSSVHRNWATNSSQARSHSKARPRMSWTISSSRHSKFLIDGHVTWIFYWPVSPMFVLHSHGLTGLRTRDSIQDFKNPLVVAYYAVDYTKNPKGTNYWRNRVLKVAKDWAGKISFAVSAKDEFQHELNEYGYDYVGDKPLILARDARNQKFIMKDEFSWVSATIYLIMFRSDNVSLLQQNWKPPSFRYWTRRG